MYLLLALNFLFNRDLDSVSSSSFALMESITILPDGNSVEPDGSGYRFCSMCYCYHRLCGLVWHFFCPFVYGREILSQPISNPGDKRE